MHVLTTAPSSLPHRYASAPGANPDAAAGNALQGSGLEADAPAEEPPPSVTKPTTELIKERAQLEAALALEVKQASGWRVASGAQRTFMWRVRALGHGVSRVRMERSRGGVPLYSSLCSEAVLLLDSAVCLFVWVGEEAPEADETLAMQLAQQYTQAAARAGGVQVSHVLASPRARPCPACKCSPRRPPPPSPGEPRARGRRAR